MSKEYKTLQLEISSEQVATVIINRPDKLNALNDEVLNELSDVTKAIKKDDAVKAVIITGAGEKAFVAGADIQEINRLDEEEGEAFSRKGQQIFQQIEDLRKPVIAAVNGYALGGGCELAMACHIRIADEKAQFGVPETGLGLIPGYGGTQRLAQLVGRAKALEMILTGLPIEAGEAERWGLVNRVVDDVEQDAQKMVKKILNNGPLAIQHALDAVYSKDENYEKEAKSFGTLCGTEDANEGTSAFLEKRKPNFRAK